MSTWRKRFMDANGASDAGAGMLTVRSWGQVDPAAYETLVSMVNPNDLGDSTGLTGLHVL